MSDAPTQPYPSGEPAPTVPAKGDRGGRTSRRTRGVITAIVVVLTLVLGLIAADRIAAFVTEGRVASALAPYGDADVSVEGVPFLTQLASGELRTVRVTAPTAQYEGIDFTDVSADLFDVPVSGDRPVGTIDAEATLPLTSIDALAREHAGVPDGMSFTTEGGALGLKGSLLGQDVIIGIAPQAHGREITVSVTSVRLGSLDVDVSTLPSFLTSGISDITIGLDFLPAGLELTGIEATSDGMLITLHGSGVSLG